MGCTKVLVAGDVQGQLDVLASRVEKLNNSAHGPFDVCFCVGRFYGSESTYEVLKPFLLGDAKFPIPLWIIPSDVQIPEYLNAHKEKLADQEFSSKNNLHWLSNTSKPQILTIENLRIVACAGTDSQWDLAKYEETLRNMESKVDILFTSQWPKEIAVERQQQQDASSGTSSVKVGQIANLVEPRYHFSGLLGEFFQKLPYENTKTKFTRFHGMGIVKEGAAKERKWLHALKLEPIATTDLSSVSVPGNVTRNPYNKSVSSISDLKRSRDSSVVKRVGLSQGQIAKLQEESKLNNQFFYGSSVGSNFRSQERTSSANGGAMVNANTKRRRKDGPQVPPRMDCWFCLASPTCEDHLIVDVGESVYLTLPKGALVPHHVLIVPIAHEPCCATLSSEDLDEVATYKDKLRKFYSKRDMVPFFFERNIIFGKAAQRHGYTEVIPIQKSKAAMLESILIDESERAGISFEQLSMAGLSGTEALQLAVQANDAVEYYFVELPSKKCFIHRIDSEKVHRGQRGPRIPIQFARQLACTIYGCPSRVDWKACVMTKEKETDLAVAFKDTWANISSGS